MKIILMLKTVELLGRNNQNFTKMLYSGVVQQFGKLLIDLTKRFNSLNVKTLELFS